MQEVGHDLGHYSCFKNLKYNYWAQNIAFTFLGGQCSSYWNKRHNEHHSKPSVVRDCIMHTVAIILINYKDK